MPDFNALAVETHRENVARGWWPEGRNRGEIMMLIVTELSEACEGLDGRPDDKLPHLPMYQVELADAAIRLLDLIGAEGGFTLRPEAVLRIRATQWGLFAPMSGEAALMTIVNVISAACEHHRKGRTADYRWSLAEALLAVFTLAETGDVPLEAIIAEKRAFNGVRPDHQIAARQAAGGKAY